MPCRDFTKIKDAIITKEHPLCKFCVHHSTKYNDCKLHGGDRRTSIVHSEVKNNSRVRRPW